MLILLKLLHCGALAGHKQEHGQRDHSKSDQRQERNRHKTEPIDPGRGAGDFAAAGRGAAEQRRFLQQIVVAGETEADQGKRQDVKRDFVVATQNAHQQNQRQRIHEDALIPAERAGYEMSDLAEIEAAEHGSPGGEQGDVKAGTFESHEGGQQRCSLSER